MPKRQIITEGLALIFQGIERLRSIFPNRKFTIDGLLVGVIGEVIAELEYDVVIHEVSQPNHDKNTTDVRNGIYRIRATFKDHLAGRVADLHRHHSD